MGGPLLHDDLITTAATNRNRVRHDLGLPARSLLREQLGQPTRPDTDGRSSSINVHRVHSRGHRLLVAMEIGIGRRSI